MMTMLRFGMTGLLAGMLATTMVATQAAAYETSMRWWAIAVVVDYPPGEPPFVAIAAKHDATQELAEDRALATCGALYPTGCEIRHTWDQGSYYVAFGNGPDGAVSWGMGPTQEAAFEDCSLKGDFDCAGGNFQGGTAGEAFAR